MLKRILLAGFLLMVMGTSAWAQKTITFASDCTWPPMEMMSTEKECVGFGPDLVNAMAKVGGFTAVIQNTAWDGIFAGLAMGKYDAISSSVSITEERKATMDFSDPYFEVMQGVVVRAGSDIKAEADLAGKTLGAQIGTTGYFAAMRIAGDKAKSYDEIGLAITDLAVGRIDAVICDDAVAADYALTNPDFKDRLEMPFVIVPDEPEYLGFAVKKGDPETLEILNKALAEVKASNEYERIYNKWFGGR